MSQAIKEFAVRLSMLFISCVVYNAAAFAQACPPGSSWCSGTYVYDAIGNIRAIGADTYVYDTAGRLVSGTADVNRTGILSRQDYLYDAFGNRTGASRIAGSVDCLGGCELSPTIDQTTNHITGSGAQYDAAGNLVFIQGTNNATYTYDAAGSLVRAAAGTDDRQFIYTADDERIATANGATWTWTVRGFDGKVLREFTSLQPQGGLPTSNWQWTKDYVWRDGLLLASVTPTTSGGTATQHFHLDHLGTPRLVTGNNGVQLSVHAYYPFGAELNLTPTEQPSELMKFTGHERDLLANDPHTLDYMHARYEMGTMGRFLSVDRHQGNPRQPQSWNRYTYADNKPVGKIDPNGWQAVVPAPSAGPSAFLSLALYHLQQMNFNPAYRDAAVNAVRTMQGLSLGLIFTVSRPFLVTPLGVILPGGKDVNLVPTSTGTEKWLQIHDSHDHDGIQPHTHEPETHIGPDGRESTRRTDRPTTADDIDKADRKVKDGELRPRTGRKDKGDPPTPAPDPKPDPPTDPPPPQLIP